MAVTPKYTAPAKGSKSFPGEEVGALGWTAKVLTSYAKPVIIPQRPPSAAAATLADLMVSLERSWRREWRGWLRLCHTPWGTQDLHQSFPQDKLLTRAAGASSQERRIRRTQSGAATQEEKELFVWPVHTCFLFQVLIPERKEKGSMFCTVCWRRISENHREGNTENIVRLP